MLIIWKAEFNGDDKQLARVSELMMESAKEVGGKADGPYFPQDADLLYLMWTKEYEDAAAKKAQEAVDADIKKAESVAAPDPADIIKYTYKDLTDRQKKEIKEFGWGS